MCATIDHLQNLLASPDSALSSCAKYALAIITDVQDAGLKRADAPCLHDMLEMLYLESNASLYEHLLDGAPDCPICAAIQKRLPA